jgi:hypothetical protein
MRMRQQGHVWIDQIAFPMPHALPGLHVHRTGVYRALVRNLAPTSPLLAGAPPMPLTVGAGKVRPQGRVLK